MRSWRGGNNSKQVPEGAKQNEAKAGNSQILHDHKNNLLIQLTLDYWQSHINRGKKLKFQFSEEKKEKKSNAAMLR